MTEKITLELTLKELQQIDKYVEKNDDTYSVLMKIKDAYPSPKTPVEEAYKEWWGQYPELETDSEYDDMRWQGFQAGYELAQVKDGCPEPPNEPEYYDEVEWDENDNTPNLQKIIDKMVEERKAQKLYNILKDRWCFSKDACEEIVEAVAEWLPKEHDTNSYKWNECLKLMREKLR